MMGSNTTETVTQNLGGNTDEVCQPLEKPTDRHVGIEDRTCGGSILEGISDIRRERLGISSPMILCVVWDVCVLPTLETVLLFNSAACYSDVKLTQMLIRQVPFF
jgi:hypothetical protein